MISATKKQLQKQRRELAESELNDAGMDIHYMDDTTIKFMYNDSEVIFYPFSGWATGKSINDGRGLQNLLKQLK